MTVLSKVEVESAFDAKGNVTPNLCLEVENCVSLFNVRLRINGISFVVNAGALKKACDNALNV